MAGGRTLLDWHFSRLASSGCELIMATTDQPNDDPLAVWAADAGVGCFRGSEHHVLSRYLECARRFNLDVIIRVTSDCPLIDGTLVKEGLKCYWSAQNSRLYLTNGHRSFARGFSFEIFSRELLEEAYLNATELYEIEHVTPYFYFNGKPDITVEHMYYPQDRSHYRVTVDTSEDYRLVRRLIEACGAGTYDYAQITTLLDNRPDLVLINSMVEQKKVA
jgi:spore coat polysaccharide biosynthesis protein SpsF